MANNEWNVVGAAVLGTSHIKSGKPCQDAFAYKQLPDGTMLIALSDGAGSAAKAEEGSAQVVQAALDSLERQLTSRSWLFAGDWDSIIRTAFEDARLALEQYVTASETAEIYTLRDYAATLLLVVLTNSWTVGGLVGDCVAVILDNTAELFTLCTPQKGEYANTTNFITQENALDQLDIQIRGQAVQGAAVFSDGLLSLALNISENKPHPPFFKPLFAFTAAIDDEPIAQQLLTEFLTSERINARTDDDKTLVLVKRN